MKFNKAIIFGILMAVFLVVVLFKGTYSSGDDVKYEYVVNEIVDLNGNVPAYDYYSDQYSKSIWGLSSYNNKIFIGLGDYDNNTGPAKIIYYDIKDKKIKSSGTIDDEAVEWFNIIDGKLYTTGTDPRAYRGNGSYYIYNENNNNWIQHQFNNGWLHVFDIEKFGGKLFMSGSIDTDNYSNSFIQVSNDNGTTFNDVPIYYYTTNISSVSSVLRAYNMFVYNNQLYAYLYAYNDPSEQYNGYYRYDSVNNNFRFISVGKKCLRVDYLVSEAASKNCYLSNAVEFNGNLVNLSGDLVYITTDVVNFKQISEFNNLAISDMLVHDGGLYFLTYKYDSNKKNFIAGIYKTVNLINFEKIFEFTASSLPYSFEYYNNNFYVGTIYSDQVKDAGNLYEISPINLKNEIVFDDMVNVDLNNMYIKFNGNSSKYFENSISVSDLISMVDVGNLTKRVNDFNGYQKNSSAKLFTGDKLLITNNNTKIEEYDISIMGDVNGDGVVDLIDMLQLRKVSAGWKAPGDSQPYKKEGIYAIAGDMNDDGKIDMIDMLRVRKIIANWKN